VRTSSFDYDLSPELIAQEPIEPRSAARLLDAITPNRPVTHRHVFDLPSLVGPGDLVVVNDTRVLPARLRLTKATGGSVEVLLLEPRVTSDLQTDHVWEALVRPGRRVPPGTRLLAEGAEVAEVGEAIDGGRRLVLLLDPGLPDRLGSVPLPSYIDRPLDDPDRYQTVYARQARSVAAPTAGLHLTEEVLAACQAAGAELATVDLAVGLDTFRPITADEVEDHHIHSERYRVAPEVLAACRDARRVVAIGTTTVRALESAARGEPEGRSTLFIHGAFDFAVVDVLLTNFHLPKSSLLVLLEAFCGPRWRQLYDTAMAAGYRFLSFGDAMIVGRA
jgi:S-adenosylmethionine:tRNA ribosyltransferase-isomerase